MESDEEVSFAEMKRVVEGNFLEIIIENNYLHRYYAQVIFPPLAYSALLLTVRHVEGPRFKISFLKLYFEYAINMNQTVLNVEFQTALL